MIDDISREAEYSAQIEGYLREIYRLRDENARLKKSLLEYENARTLRPSPPTEPNPEY